MFVGWWNLVGPAVRGSVAAGLCNSTRMEENMEKSELFRLSRFKLRRRIASKANVNTMDAIEAVNRFRRKLDMLPGQTERKYAQLIQITGLDPKTVTLDIMIDKLLELWWSELQPLIKPYDRESHQFKRRAIPIRRKIKKAKEYFAKYEIESRKEFDRLVANPLLQIKEAVFPYITVSSDNPGYINRIDREFNSFCIESNVFEVI